MKLSTIISTFRKTEHLLAMNRRLALLRVQGFTERSLASRTFLNALAVGLILLFGLPSTLRSAAAAKAFPTAEAAVLALDKAADSTNRAAFIELFGAASEQLVNPDPIQGAQELANFSTAFNVTNHLVRESDTRMTLEIGPDGWPFPIPLVKVAEGWQFDTAAGVEEILNRRIGRNELHTLSVLRAYVAAQGEYSRSDRDGDDVLEYAQRVASLPDKTDGLYWNPELNGEISPLGPLMAEAQGEGYYHRPGETNAAPQPFHGYLYKILTGQGANAPGGRYDYIINGNMIGGFAMVAWPAEYGESGIMTFIVNQRGRVYQKDLGDDTEKTVQAMTEYDPDSTWQISRD